MSINSSINRNNAIKIVNAYNLYDLYLKQISRNSLIVKAVNAEVVTKINQRTKITRFNIISIMTMIFARKQLLKNMLSNNKVNIVGTNSLASFPFFYTSP